MFRSMSDEHDLHVHPPKQERFRFTFKRRFRRAEVLDNIIASGFSPDGRFYMLTTGDGVTRGFPMKGCRILIEPM
jgi:hypothetical protein